MRKPDEILLYAALMARARKHKPEAFRVPFAARPPGSIYAIEEEAERLGIPEKRAYAIVSKWCDRNWWDYGVSLRGGWFTDKAPDELKP